MATSDVAPPTNDDALEALLRERRFGPPEPNEATPWAFVRLWPDAIVRGRVWPIISRLLTDDDELIRARAIEFVRVWSEGADLTKSRMLDVAERHPELYGDQAPEGVSLRHELAFALCNDLDENNGARSAAVLREMATREPIGGGAASVLGKYEPELVGTLAQKWGDEQVRWILEATRSLALLRRDAIIPFLRTLRGLRPSTRARVLEVVEEHIQRDDTTAAALAQGQRLPPPSKPAPSADECKNAVGMNTVRRDLELSGPNKQGVTGYRAEHVLLKLFAVLVPDRPIPGTPTTPPERSYSWGLEQEYRNAQGDGLLIGEQCVRSALPGENVDTVYSLRIVNELGVFVEIAQDYQQDTLEFQLRAIPEMLDIATDALLQIAAAAGLVFVRRTDQI